MGGGGGVLQNGKIVKTFCAPPQDRLKLFVPHPLLKGGNFVCPSSVWLKLLSSGLKNCLYLFSIL